MAKPIQVTYSRTVADGHYGNRKFEVVMDIEDGETAEDAMDAAKAFVALQIEQIPKQEYEDHPF